MTDAVQDAGKEIIDATLPVEFGHGLVLDPNKAREWGEELSGTYCFAEPFPHIVIDNFLPAALAEKVLANFPAANRADASDVVYSDGMFQHNKRQIQPAECNEFVVNVFNFFNSAPFLQFLEGLTTIQGLISDPYFEGGGFHEISQGGKLGIHADFMVNSRLHLRRRLNLLIYLNRDWQEEYGGCLEIWDKSMQKLERSIQPLFNRCVIFNTDLDSYHGHPDPLNVPDGVTRKSIATYYYTGSQSIYSEVPTYTTRFQARPHDEPAIQAAARTWQWKSHFRYSEWLPPVLVRNLRALKRKLQRR
ncbi:MAG TPA: 2OG-Fe(II) oxygenase [Burkholderiaceae bacterium]